MLLLVISSILFDLEAQLPSQTMPIALPSSQSITLRYSAAASPLTGHTDELKLLELSPEILRLIEAAGEDEPLSLTIKGRPGDDAVICTPTATFQLRNISVSNSLLIFKPPTVPSSNTPPTPTRDDKLAGQTSLDLSSTCTDILEMIPTFPKLDRIEKVLKESRWEGMDAGGESRGRKRRIGMNEDELEHEDGRRCSDPPHKEFTLPQLKSLVQASDGELYAGLRARNVIILPSLSHSSIGTSGEPGGGSETLLHLPHVHLSELLGILLSLVVIHRIGPAGHQVVLVDARAIIRALGGDHGGAGRSLDEAFVRGVMDLFGKLKGSEASRGTDGTAIMDLNKDLGDEGGASEAEEVWECDIVAMVRELGKGLLSQLSKSGPKSTQDSFLAEWAAQVGASFDDLVDMKMLEGEYLLQPSSLGSPLPSIQPFPLSALPSDPTARFSDLFLTRARWRPEEMKPFLRGLTIDGDSKGMDKLVAKYVRVVKEREGVWWYPRRLG